MATNFYGCLLLLILLFFILGPTFFLVTFTIPLLFLLTIVGILALKLGPLIYGNINIDRYVSEQGEAHQTFGEFLVQFMIAMAKVDGEVDRRAISLIKGFFKSQMGYNAVAMVWVDRMIRKHYQQPVDKDQMVDDFNERFGQEEKKLLLQLLYMVALVDGQVSKSEQYFIDFVIQSMSISQADHDLIRNMLFRSGQNPQPLKVLGLSDGATKEEIKKRYRQLSIENHPDKVAHLGDDFRQIAEKKMSEINRAYEDLKKMNKA